MAAPSWLTTRPIAHRGLPDPAKRLVENTIGAAQAAIAQGFAIECDVQLTADGEVVVFHDEELERLTTATGPVASRTLSDLVAVRLRHTDERIPTLQAFLAAVAGRVPVICEVKSAYHGDPRPAARTVAATSSYEGPLALKSFDPAFVAEFRRLAPERPRGFVGESVYDDAEWDFLTEERKRAWASLAHFSDTRPDFLSWYQRDLDHATPVLARGMLGMPLISWTVRTPDIVERVLQGADQIVFEGFIP